MEINNKELIDLIDKMKEEKTQESQNKVIGQVLKSKFLCPVVLADAPKGGGKVQITKDTKIQFSIIKTTDERSFLIAFTSDEEVNKWQKEKMQQSIVYTFEDYAKIVTENENLHGFIIDPKGANLVFTEDMIKQIKTSITKVETLEPDTEVQIAAPKEYPEELLSKLQDTLRNYTEVKKAYLLLMKKGEEVSYILILDASGKEQELFNTIASSVIPFLDGMSLNMAPLATDFGNQISQRFEPIYIAVEE